MPFLKMNASLFEFGNELMEVNPEQNVTCEVEVADSRGRNE